MLSAKRILVVQLASVMVVVIAVLGHKLGNLPFKLTAIVFAIVALILFACALVSLCASVYSLVRSRPWLLWWCNVAVSMSPILLFSVLVGFSALTSPRIHDISTRFDPAILFEHAHTLRLTNENPLTKPLPDVIAKQQAYYTYLQPLLLPEQLTSCFARGLAEVNALGWRITWMNDSEALKAIEAVEETALFGFKDDIRIEFAARGLGCEVNMRSVSRVGVGDLGANAKRIEHFFKRMRL